MNLKSGNLLWPKQSGRLYKYSQLRENISCDVIIVGGGIIGGLIAYYLAKKNLSVVLVDKRDIGQGSTSASTALIMYQLDVNLSDLIKKIGNEKAVRAYKLSRDSIGKFKKLIQELNVDCGFRSKKALYLASKKSDVSALRREYQALKKNGFDVDFLNKQSLAAKFSIAKEAALLVHEAAEVNPYALTEQLVHQAQKNGAKIYTGTEIVKYREEKKTKILITKSGQMITARKVIFSTGYESQQYLKKKVVDLKSSYVVASGQIPKLKTHWLKDYLVWETARPYLYIRTASDQKVIVGGLDEDFADANKRDRLIPRKSKQLEGQSKKLIKDILFVPKYSWAGTFGETKDGLGYVGVPKEFKHVYFALGFGGNGINFGIIAAEIISKLVLGKKSNDQDLFSFRRLS